MPVTPSANLGFEEALARARRAWLHEMREYVGRFPTVVQMPPTLSLAPKRLEACKVVASRKDLLTRYPKGGCVIEIGVLEGHFSRDILTTLQPSILYLLDLSFEAFRPLPADALAANGTELRLLEGDSKIALPMLPRASIDLAYVDADHSYPAVKTDLQNLNDKMTYGGRILLNDYTYWSPQECIPYGVVQAVNEFCEMEDWELEYIALEERMYLDVALKRRGEP